MAARRSTRIKDLPIICYKEAKTYSGISKKVPAKKDSVKKAAVKKATAKKAPPKKALAKKAPAKKGPTKPTTAETKKALAKKAPAKKTSAKKAPVKNAPVKNARIKKTPAKKRPTKPVTRNNSFKCKVHFDVPDDESLDELQQPHVDNDKSEDESERELQQPQVELKDAEDRQENRHQKPSSSDGEDGPEDKHQRPSSSDGEDGPDDKHSRPSSSDDSEGGSSDNHQRPQFTPSEDSENQPSDSHQRQSPGSDEGDYESEAELQRSQVDFHGSDDEVQRHQVQPWHSVATMNQWIRATRSLLVRRFWGTPRDRENMSHQERNLIIRFYDQLNGMEQAMRDIGPGNNNAPDVLYSIYRALTWDDGSPRQLFGAELRRQRRLDEDFFLSVRSLRELFFVWREFEEENGINGWDDHEADDHDPAQVDMILLEWEHRIGN